MFKILNLIIIAILIIFAYGCNKTSNITIDIDQKSAKNHPNILLIIADDMGLDATPGYNVGNIKPNMPNLTKLQLDGITYENVWSSPSCAPTRATIITGKYGVRNGVLNTSNAGTLSLNEKTLQAYLDEQLGKIYSHSIIGKWHLSNNEPSRPNQMGIDHFAGLIPGTISDYSNWNLTINGITNSSSEYITTKLTDLAIEWINEQNKPWFCWLAYTAPHSPFHLPGPEMHSQVGLSIDQSKIDENPLPYFIAMIESLDHQMGRLLNTLSNEDKENTYIIFLGDNGTPSKVVQPPYLSNRSKGSLYQGGINVPMVIAGPNVERKGQRDISLIHSVDLFATIVEMTGINQSSYLDSQSFYRTFNSNILSKREFNYSEILDTEKPAKSGCAIRDNQYKIIILDNNQIRFFDLKNDPFEKNNLNNNILSDNHQVALEKLLSAVSSIR